MRLVLLVFAAIFAIGAANPRPPVPANAAVADWSKSARLTPAGTVIVGNPAARFKLVEYLSFTCPHCAQFARDSADVLQRRLIASGKVSIEYRPLVGEEVALSATIVARCAAPARYPSTIDTIFARQDIWLPIAANFFEREARRFADAKPLERVQIAAQTSGLYDIAREQGLKDAQLAQCFANGPLVGQVLRSSDSALKTVRSTPSFTLGGADTGAHDWPSLERVLRAKGAL